MFRVKQLFGSIGVVMLLIICVGVLGKGGQAVSTYDIKIENAGFEQALLADGTIPSWGQTFGVGAADVSYGVSDTTQYEGDYSLALLDASRTAPLGVESDRFEIEGGVGYSATAMFQVVEGNLAIYLQFFDDSGTRITNVAHWVGTTEGEWTRESVSALAPDDAVSASVLLYSSVSGQGKGYVDEVKVKMNPIGTFNDIGQPIMNFIHMDSAIGEENGRPISYTVAKGANDETVFAVIDILTAEVTKTMPMPGVEGAWAVRAASDGKIYAGSHYNGRLYQYTPGANEMVDLGRLGEETHVWSMTAGADGKMYIGTYPNGHVYEYDPAGNQLTDLGRMHPTEKYVRALIYSPELNALYAGVGGDQAYLYKIDLDSGEKTELLSELIPQDHSKYSFTYSLGYALGKVFVRVNKPDQLLVIDAASGELEYYDPSVSISMGVNKLAVKPGEDKIYFGGYRLYTYDIHTKTFTNNVFPNNQTWVTYQEAKFIDLNDPEWPGFTFVAAAEKGSFLLFHPESGKMKTMKVDNYGAPVLIQSLSAGFDGNIYIGGYLGATGFTSYSPEDGTFSPQREFGQVESVSSVGNKLYIGTYGNARIHEYDPAEPWSSQNPRRVAELINFEQDRPFALLGVDSLNKLFVGSVPDYGSHQGALTIYDTNTGAVEVHKSIVNNQGVVSLVDHDGFIYGGTTIHGGLGTSGPAADEAKLFVFDTSTNEKIFEAAPVPGREVVSGLLVGPDELIWGVAEDHIFKFDPNTMEFVYNEPHLDRYGSGIGTVWVDAFLENGIDGNVYGTNKRGHFFMIDPETMEFATIQSGAGSYLTQDHYGNLYMSKGPNLIKYVIPTNEKTIAKYVEQQAAAGVISHPLYKQLTNSLKQAIHHYEAGRSEQAVKHLDHFLKHLHRASLMPTVQLPLEQQVNTLIEIWSDQ